MQNQNILIIEPDKILIELEKIFTAMQMQKYVPLVKKVYKDTISIYMGKWPGLRPCQSPYHDMFHVLTTALASMRLLHGAKLLGEPISPKAAIQLLVASLFHDIGFISAQHEAPGPAHSIYHEERSVDFMHRYVDGEGWKVLDFMDYGNIILATKMSQSPGLLKFKNRESLLLGYLLGTSDLISQMADRFYLEKLFYMYQEQFYEGTIMFPSLDHVYRGSRSFYKNVVVNRLNIDFKGVHNLAGFHFDYFYGTRHNVYMEGIQKNLDYLDSILEKDNYFAYLRRRVPYLDSVKNMEYISTVVA